ncbi:unnamed protein product, partial [Mesorhabditis belari]|uniref:AB hydrolase-1 domain-containing protein n=1 Tax=Mesorhabditis belari TaxID=2138241 RepID=A0AAF3F4J5_9BILA
MTENGQNGHPEQNGQENGQPTAVTEAFEKIQDLQIGYCRYGNGPNNMLFICGAVGCYKKDWPSSVLQQFDPALVTIICIDPPGYGTSRPPDRKQEVNRCMKDSVFCLELMNKLDLNPFTIVGWSEGARTAVHVAASGKQKVNRMILLAAGTKVDQRGAWAFRGMRDTDLWLPNARAPYLAHYSNDFLKKQWADLCDVVQEVFDMMGGRFTSDLVLSSIKCPSLIMTGGQDRFCTDPKVNFTPVLKNCRVETHLHGGHDFHIKYAKWFAEKVQNFIKETQ